MQRIMLPLVSVGPNPRPTICRLSQFVSVFPKQVARKYIKIGHKRFFSQPASLTTTFPAFNSCYITMQSMVVKNSERQTCLGSEFEWTLFGRDCEVNNFKTPSRSRTEFQNTQWLFLTTFLFFLNMIIEFRNIFNRQRTLLLESKMQTVSMALQPFAGPWWPFQFVYLLRSR
jgi:hypothetical protein